MFAMDKSQTADVAAVYDRAALIAMPPELRQKYVEQLAQLTPADVSGILISMNYDPSKMKGPPFSIIDSEARRLLEPHFGVEVIAHSLGPDRLGNLADRGLDTLEEHVYRITRKI